MRLKSALRRGVAAAVIAGIVEMCIRDRSKAVQTDCLMEVAAGTADAAILDLTLASAMIGEGTDYANLKMVDELNVEEYGVAFRKGSDMAEAVDNAFDELKRCV